MELSDEDLNIKSQIIQKVQSFDIRNKKEYGERYPPQFRTAAVLMPLKVCNGKVYILLTRRAKSLRSHAYETACPGGMMEESDSSVIQTALREADEEIGLPPSSVEIISVLTRSITSRHVIVYPVVGFIPNDFQPTINPSEVDLAFFMPLGDFLCEDKISVSIWPLGFGSYINRELNYKDGDDEVMVWGLTSSFCIFLAKIVLGKPDYLALHVGCTNTGHISDCLEEYFKLSYNFIMAKSVSKL